MKNCRHPTHWLISTQAEAHLQQSREVAKELEKGSSYELTGAKLEKKEQLLREGFVDWTRKDFRSFLNAMERRGRDEVDVIARETSNETGKTEDEVRVGVDFCLRGGDRVASMAPNVAAPRYRARRDAVAARAGERRGSLHAVAATARRRGNTHWSQRAQVRRYHTVFWQRHKELADWERVIDKIEKGEKRLQRSKEIREALAEKIARSPKPHECLPLNYGASRGKVWTEEEDAYFVCVEINQCVGCARQFFTKSFLGDDAAVLAPSSGEEPAPPLYRAGVASMQDDATIQHERAVKF